MKMRTRSDVVVRTATGAMLVLAPTMPVAGQATRRLSVDSAENQGAGDCDFATISADGRYVAFENFAETLVSGDTNHWQDVFLRDRLTGMTERVSVASDGTQGNDTSFSPSVSADGRHVALVSTASNLNGWTGSTPA